MAGLLAPKSILESGGSKAPIDFNAIEGVDKPIDFSAANIKPANPFTPNKFQNPDDPAVQGAAKDLITNLTLAIPRSFARFALSAGEAVPRIAGGVLDLAGVHNNLATTVVPPTRIPGAGFLGDIQSYQSEFNKGEAGYGKTAFNIATDEPLGLALKPALLGVGLLARSFGKNVIDTLAKEVNPDTVLNILKKTYPKAPVGDLESLAPKIAATTDKKAVQGLLSDFTKTGTKTIVQESKKAPASKVPSPESVPPTGKLPPKLPSETSYASDVKNLANEKLNVENFNVSPEAKAIIDRTVEEVKPQIQTKVGTVLSNTEALKAAEDSSKILTRAIGRDQTLEWQAAMLRARQSLAAASKSGTVDEQYVKNLLAIKTAGTDIARKLQSLSIGAEAKDITGKQAIIEAVLKAVGDADKVIQASKGVDFTNLNAATDFYRNFIKPTTSEWLDLIRYNSMLSSPTTHLINVFSNLLNTTLVAPLEKAMTGGLDFLGSKVTGRARQAFAGESGAFLKGYLTNVKEATFRFADVMRGKRAYTNLDTKNIPIAASGVKGAVVKTLSFPMRLLEASDQFFTALAEGGETASLKYRQGKGVKVGNIETQAQRGAAYRLFRQDLFDENQGHLLDAVDQLTSKLQNLRNNPNPIVSNAAKFTVPFLRTPMNIFKQGLEYSPIGFGTIPGAVNKTEQLSKAVIGSSVFAASYMMLASNRLTWGQPTDPAQLQAFKAAGMQPYSVKIGNTWVSYQKLPPALAFPLAMVAAIHDTQQNKNIDDNTVDLVLTGVAKYGQFLGDQSYAKSIGDLLAAAKGGESGIERVVSNYGQQVVPFRALGGWLARLFDTTQRKVDSSAPFIDQQVQLLMMNIPGLSQKVPARLDASGKPIPQPFPYLNAVSPVRFSKESPQGSAEFRTLLEIQKANKETTFNTKQFESQARSELNKIDALSSPEEKKAYLKEVAKSNPELAKKVIAALQAEKKSLSVSDQKLANAPVETRARFIIAELNRLKTPEEKKALLKNYAKKKIVTAATLKEIAKQMKGQ